MHPLRVGIAYWYRGHYLYGAALNPVEPQPFATKKKVLLNGVQRESAPIYSQTDEDLVPEPVIGFLPKARWTEFHFPGDPQVPEAPAAPEPKAVDSDAGRISAAETTSSSAVDACLYSPCASGHVEADQT